MPQSLTPEYYITAYGIAVKWGFTGTEQEWLESLKVKGDPGKSAYQYAVEAGYQGTEQQFYLKMVSTGKSAYEYAVENGYTGTEQEFGIKLGALDIRKIVAEDGTELLPDLQGVLQLTPADLGALSLKGGTVSGQILLPQPQSPEAAVPRSYADKKLPLAGGTMEGSIDMGGNSIGGVGDPEKPGDLATKRYTDARILRFADIVIQPEAFAEGSPKEKYPLQAKAPCLGARAEMVPIVSYSDDDADSGNFAPTADSTTDGVMIYAKTRPETAMTIPVILTVR